MTSIEKRLASFDRVYDVSFSEEITNGDKLYIGSKKDRFCRFCNLKEPEVSFKSIAHAIPESIGNKRVILLNECDSCNTYFSNGIENSFDKFTKPFRVLFGIKGKKKAPSYKTRDKQARLDVGNGKIVLGGEEKQIFTAFSKEKVQLKLERESYIPIEVYMALLKMAISISNENNLLSLKNHINWIRFPDKHRAIANKFILVERMSYGPSISAGSVAMLYTRKLNASKANPYMLFHLVFGSMSYQIAIPELGKEIQNIPLLPLPSEQKKWKYKQSQEIKDMSSIELTEREYLSINLVEDITSSKTKRV